MQIEHRNMCRRQAKTRGHKIWRMWGKNPNVGKPFDQIFLLLFNSSVEGESTNIKLTCPKQSCQISSQHQSTAALTRKSTLVKEALKFPPSSSVNSKPIRPSKRVKFSPKQFSQPSQGERKHCCNFCCRIWSQPWPNCPNHVDFCANECGLQKSKFCPQDCSQRRSNRLWSTLICFPEIWPADNPKNSSSCHMCEVERSCLQAVWTKQERS